MKRLFMTQYRGEKLKFAGVGGRDVYNITAPFEIDRTVYIAGRVEHRRETLSSETIFFVERNGIWYPVENLPVFLLEDPFVTTIDGKFVFGGVHVDAPDDKNGFEYAKFHTVVYTGRDIHDLKKHTTGPRGMKDIRFVELQDGSVGVFTRPQGKIGGKGKIGFLHLDSLGDLSLDTLSSASLIHDHFGDEMWGGVNDAYVLDDGTIGVIGHIAHFDKQGAKHYMVISFIFNPKTHNTSSIDIIARRSDFPPGPAKQPGFEDIVFPGGLVRYNDMATLYVGLSDVEVGKIDIPDPFSKRSLNVN